MYEENAILTRIEKLVEKLPYEQVTISIEMKDKTLTPHKEMPRTIGFCTEPQSNIPR